MPQIFNVLRCYKCFIFQIHQIKKSTKWECKMCGEKQSIKRHYGIGSSKDCRLHVQKLNLLQSNKHSDDTNSNSNDSDHEDNIYQNISDPPAKVSKWSHYIGENEVEREPVLLNSTNEYEKEISKGNQFEKPNEFISDIDIRKRKTRNNKNILKFVSPSRKEHSGIGIDVTSKHMNFNQISNYQYNNGKNKQYSSSKWNNFLEDEGQSSSSLDLNLSSNVSKRISNVESAMKLVNKQQSKISGTLLCNATDLINQNGRSTSCKQTIFSMCDDHDLDSILDF